jgi:hypothetical protein
VTYDGSFGSWYYQFYVWQDRDKVSSNLIAGVLVAGGRVD